MTTDTKETKIFASEEDVGLRLDQMLARNLSDYSRSYFQRLIEEGLVIVNSQSVKPRYKVRAGDSITIRFLEIAAAPDLRPEPIPLDIIFENDDVIVVNKPAGLVVHPAAGNPSGTLVNALIEHFPPITKAILNPKDETASIRPGLVHRLDKDTSGVLVVAKNARAMHSLARQIQNRTVKKIYLGICAGCPKSDSGTLINNLGRDPKNRKMVADIGPENGKEAISDFQVLSCTKNIEAISLIQFDIKTGRTHQIRVQSKLFHHPILGDEVYADRLSRQLSKKMHASRQLLHAWKLLFCLPGEKSPRTFIAPLPADFKDALQRFGENILSE